MTKASLAIKRGLGCRYWIAGTYEERHAQSQEPQNVDKEFLRLWFRQNCDPYNDKVGTASCSCRLTSGTPAWRQEALQCMAWRAWIEYDDFLAECCRLLRMPCDCYVCMTRCLYGAC